jgi:putative ABC transport system permease protein
MRNKSFSLINIFGFSFSLACCLMIYSYIHFEYSYNTFLPDHERIFQVMNDSTSEFTTKFQIDHRYADYLPETYPQIQAATSFHTSGTRIKYDENHYIEKIILTDSSFFKVFSFPFLSGSSRRSFGPGKVIISQRLAENIFNSVNPIGETITLGLDSEYTVAGIIENVPENSSLKFDVVIPHDNKISRSESCSDNVCIYPKYVFIKTQLKDPLIDLNTENKAQAIFNDKFPIYFALQSLDDLYLNDRYNVGGLEKGNHKLINIFLAIGFIILTLAILNYVNLSLSKIVSRYKEIGLKKVIGATRIQLSKQILLESVLVTTVSFLIAILIAEIISPTVAVLYGKDMSTNIFLNFPEILIVLVLPVIVGIIAGFYPSLVFSRYSPKRLLSGFKVNKSGKNPFVYYLTIFQFSAAIILISSTIIMFLQIDYVKHKDLGFNESQLLRINLYGPAAKKSKVFLNSLNAYPGIEGVTVSQGVPGLIGYTITSNDTEGKSVRQINIDLNFLDVFEIELDEGRYLLPSDTGEATYINQTALELLEWESFEGRKFSGKEIIGVVKDFHTGSMYENFEPIFLVCDRIDKPSHMTVRIAANQIKETMDFINVQWKKVSPDFPIFFEFYDDYFDSMYKKEEQLSRLMAAFSILAIIISCLGIIGMVEFSAVNKTKEIGIRKTLGAKTIDIIQILSKSYLLVLGVSVIIAIPVAWKIVSLWLQSFAFRIELSWIYFIFTGGIVAIISLNETSF